MTGLLAEIVKAFPPRPLDPTIFVDSSGRWEGYTEARAFEAGVRGHSWDTLPPEFVEFHFNALGYMTPDAFAALLPAYLTALIRGTQNELPVFVLASLTRKGGWQERFDAKVPHLTEQQQSVIVRMLHTLAETERFSRLYRAEISEAIDNWPQ